MIWYVAIGGAAGSVSRFVFGAMIQRWTGAPFPFGTLIVNVTGCFFFGCIGGLGCTSCSASQCRSAPQSPAWRPRAMC